MNKKVFYDHFFERVAQSYQLIYQQELPQMLKNGSRPYNHLIAVKSKESPHLGLQLMWGDVNIGKGGCREMELRIQLIKHTQKGPFDKLNQYVQEVPPYAGSGSDCSLWRSHIRETKEFSMFYYLRVPHPDAYVKGSELGKYLKQCENSEIFKVAAEVIHHHASHLKTSW